MGELNVHIRHGGGSNPLAALMNPKVLVIGGLAAVIAVGGGAGALTAGLTTLLEWAGGVMAVAAAVTGTLVVRHLRKSPTRAYIRSVHGPTARDLVLDEKAELRRQIALARAARWQLDVARAIQEASHPGPCVYDYSIQPDMIQHGTITGRVPAWPQESVPVRPSLTGLTPELPPVPGRE